MKGEIVLGLKEKHQNTDMLDMIQKRAASQP